MKEILFGIALLFYVSYNFQPLTGEESNEPVNRVSVLAGRDFYNPAIE